MNLSAIVLTKNEERNIEDCLSSLSWADERLVIDSGSTDATVPLAEKCGARVIRHGFVDFSTQRNFAMEKAKGDWVLFVDADERVTPELAVEIKAVLDEGDSPSQGVCAKGRLRPTHCGEKGTVPLCVYAIPRHNFFFGKRLRFGDAGNDAPLRLFPRWFVSWIQPVHEKIKSDLPCHSLKSSLIHYSTRDLNHYRQKIREYVPLELETMRSKGLRPSLLKVILTPPAKFFYLYFFKLGVFDGLAGFHYAILSAYYTFEKHWRYWKASLKSSF